jgi:hypothetical protein
VGRAGQDNIHQPADAISRVAATDQEAVIAADRAT